MVEANNGEHMCKDCQHKDICKYKDEFMKEYDLLVAGFKARTNSIHSIMNMCLNCKHWYSDCAPMYIPSINPFPQTNPCPHINPITYNHEIGDPVPNPYEITC